MKNTINDIYNIDWSSVEDVQELRNGADLFESEKNYTKSKELLLKAYDKSRFRANILKSLIRVSLKLNQVNDAKNYLDEYYANYNKDVDIEYLEYKVKKKLGLSTDALIEILQHLQDEYYAEEWMFDLACEYENAGLIQDCINQCEKIELWFDHGLYVSKALRLKKRYKPLTEDENDKLSEFEEELTLEEEIDDENLFDSDNSEIVQSSEIHEEPINILNDEDYDVKIYNPKKIKGENELKSNVVDSILKNIEEYENDDIEGSMFGSKKKKVEDRVSISDLENEEYAGDLDDIDYLEEEYLDDEYLDDVYLDEEYLDDEYLDEEYPDDEYLDDEYLDDEYLDEEYPDDEYLDDEYLDEEYLDEEYLDDEILGDELSENLSVVEDDDINNDSCKVEQIHNKAILADYEDLTDEELAIILEGEKDDLENEENLDNVEHFRDEIKENISNVDESVYDNYKIEEDTKVTDNVDEVDHITDFNNDDTELVNQVDNLKPEVNKVEEIEKDEEAAENEEAENIGYLAENYLKLPDDEDIKYENQNMEDFTIKVDKDVIEKIEDKDFEKEVIQEVYLDEVDEKEVDNGENTIIKDDEMLDEMQESSIDSEIIDSVENDTNEDGEKIDDEYLDEEYLDDEYLDEEYLDDEYLDEEYLDEEYLDDEYLDDEYLDDEYLDEEYLDDEYLDDEYNENRFNTTPLVSSVNIDENFEDIIPEDNALNLDSFASFGKGLREAEKVIRDIDNFEEKIRYNKSHILLQCKSKELLEAFALTYCKIRGMTSVRKVSTISGDKLNLLDIKELYRKIPNTFLVVKNSEDISEETYNAIVKAVNFNENTIIVFTTDKENIGLENHLLDKMVAIKKTIPIVINDQVTYSILYAGIKGYGFTEYALEVINANISEITSKNNSLSSFEKVVNCSILKQKQYIEENLLNDLVVGTYSNETTIGDTVVMNAIQELMDRNLI